LAVGDAASAVEEVYADRVEVSDTGFSILDGIITGEIGPLPEPSPPDDDATDDTADDADDASGGEVVLSMRSGAQLCEDD
jgi:hypothetical protein